MVSEQAWRRGEGEVWLTSPGKDIQRTHGSERCVGRIKETRRLVGNGAVGELKMVSRSRCLRR